MTTTNILAYYGTDFIVTVKSKKFNTVNVKKLFLLFV
jgi:hypothetical protein